MFCFVFLPFYSLVQTHSVEGGSKFLLFFIYKSKFDYSKAVMVISYLFFYLPFSPSHLQPRWKDGFSMIYFFIDPSQLQLRQTGYYKKIMKIINEQVESQMHIQPHQDIFSP